MSCRWPALGALCGVLLGALWAPMAPAQAEAPPIRLVPDTPTPPTAPPGRHRLRALWAGPDAPRIALELDHAGVVIGHLGDWLPVAGHGAGDSWVVGLSPQLEVEGSPIPFRFWRGRIAAEAGASRSLVIAGRRAQLDLGGGVMHESDHITYIGQQGPRFGQLDGVMAVVVNDVFARATVRVPVGHWDVATTLTPRFHVLTCTAARPICAAGTEGDVTLGGGLDVVAVGLRPGVLGLSPFVSARVEGHAPHARALAEWRMALRAGWVNLYGPHGAWQFALEARLGQPVGVYRGSASPAGRALISLGWSR